jgi:hypothetical protein
MSFSVTSQQPSIDVGEKKIHDAILFLHSFFFLLLLLLFSFHILAFEQINKRQ